MDSAQTAYLPSMGTLTEEASPRERMKTQGSGIMDVAGVPAVQSAFDEIAWRITCERLASDSNHGCGLSHDLFVCRLSGAVEAAVLQLPEVHRAKALYIAREWDYATRSEIDEMQQWNAENGYCCHGIELGCCPAGCDEE